MALTTSDYNGVITAARRGLEGTLITRQAAQQRRWRPE